MAKQQQLTADEAAVLAAGGDPSLMEKGGGKGGCPASQRAADGGLSGGKSGGKEMVKGDDEDDDDDELENDDTEKSGIDAEIIDAEDLIKSMAELEAASNGLGGDSDRRSELAAGLTNGTLSKSEKEELRSLVDSEPETTDEDFEKSWQEEFGDELGGEGDYDVSEFLGRQTKMIAKSLDNIRREVRAGDESQRQFNSALAKSLRNMGEIAANQQSLIKALVDQNAALSDRLGVVERVPNARKSRQTPKALKKSQDGEVGAGDGLSREEILDGLNRLMVKSRDNGFIAPCQEPVDRAVALYEVQGKITRGMLGDVADILGKQIQF